MFYLLHGCCDTYDSWTRETDVEQLRRLRKVLVVMPEAGPVGFYSNCGTTALAARRRGRHSTCVSCAGCWNAAMALVIVG